MAVLMRTEMQGVTMEQMRPFWDQVKARIRSFPGFIAQASGPIPGGVQVTEVWSRKRRTSGGRKRLLGLWPRSSWALLRSRPYSICPSMISSRAEARE
ncbi:MAG TPA: hypothetical protein VF808_16610 [Ktedonobacterales bacterium]